MVSPFIAKDAASAGSPISTVTGSEERANSGISALTMILHPFFRLDRSKRFSVLPIRMGTFFSPSRPLFVTDTFTFKSLALGRFNSLTLSYSPS